MKDDPNASLSKEIYPALAKTQGGTATSVEKNIRDAIGYAYRNRNEAVWARYFPVAPNGQVPKPTNRAFLATLAQRLFAASRDEINCG